MQGQKLRVADTMLLIETLKQPQYTTMSNLPHARVQIVRPTPDTDDNVKAMDTLTVMRSSGASGTTHSKIRRPWPAA